MTKIHSIPVGVVNFGPDKGSNMAQSDKEVMKTLQEVGEGDIQLPFDLEFDNVTTKFVEVILYINTSDLLPSERMFLQLFITNFFETSIQKGGVEIAHDDVVHQLTQDTVSFEAGLGIMGGSSNFSCGPFSQYLKIRMKAVSKKYPKILSWLCDLLLHPVYSEDRLRVSCHKLINDIPDHKRESFDMAQVMSLDMNFHNKNSNYYAVNVLRQEKFLKQVLEDLTNSSSKVINQLDTLRSKLCNFDNMVAQVIGNVHEISKPISSWKTFFAESSCGGNNFAENASPRSGPDEKTIINDSNLYTRKECSYDGYIVSLPSSESSYLVACTKGPSSFSDPDIPALRVLLAYFSLFEGVFWVEIRGSGYAYSCDFSMSVDQGLIYFTLYRCTNLHAAFSQSKKLVEFFDLGVMHFTTNELEAARSGCIFSKIASEETVSQAAFENFVDPHFKGVSREMSKEYLNQIQAVTRADLKRVLKKYIVDLFEPGKCSIAITSNPEHVGELVANMKKASFNLTQLENLESIASD